MNKNYFEIKRAGINTTFQDQGRTNLYHIGIPFSGAMDNRNFQISNKLVGNETNSPVIEFAYQGPLLKYFGDDIKCAEYATFGTKELSENMLIALEKRKACLMSNHGQVALGKNLEEAFELAQEVENICHQYTIALRLGQPKILSFEEMKKVLNKAKNYKKG